MVASITSNFNRLWQRKPVRLTLQIVWVGLIVFFIVYAILANRETITSIEWTPERLGFMGLAIIATLLRRLAGGLRWVWLVRLLGKGQTLTIRQGLKIYFVANLATYIPGTYWFVLGRVTMSQKHGISALQTGVSTLVEQFLLILSGALLGIFGLQLITDLLGVPVNSFLWIVLIILIGLIAIHPWSIRQITNLMARILKMQPVEINLSYTMMLVQLLWSIVIWLFGSLSLLFLAHAFIPTIGLGQLGVFSAIFSISWLVGFFTPFAPSGLGVREGVMVGAFTAMGISTGVTALLAVLSRVLIIFEDVFWAAFSVFL
jgi:uncharacterized membrane protein YbhN (UPF0104 family)